MINYENENITNITFVDSYIKSNRWMRFNFQKYFEVFFYKYIYVVFLWRFLLTISTEIVTGKRWDVCLKFRFHQKDLNEELPSKIRDTLKPYVRSQP